jgi:hypothetical protein
VRKATKEDVEDDEIYVAIRAIWTGFVCKKPEISE